MNQETTPYLRGSASHLTKRFSTDNYRFVRFFGFPVFFTFFFPDPH
jgi:hypothetical protein